VLALHLWNDVVSLVTAAAVCGGQRRGDEIYLSRFLSAGIWWQFRDV